MVGTAVQDATIAIGIGNATDTGIAIGTGIETETEGTGTVEIVTGIEIEIAGTEIGTEIEIKTKKESGMGQRIDDVLVLGKEAAHEIRSGSVVIHEAKRSGVKIVETVDAIRVESAVKRKTRKKRNQRAEAAVEVETARSGKRRRKRNAAAIKSAATTEAEARIREIARERIGRIRAANAKNLENGKPRRPLQHAHLVQRRRRLLSSSEPLKWPVLPWVMPTGFILLLDLMTANHNTSIEIRI